MIREMVPSDAPAIESILAVSPGASRWSAGELIQLASGGARIWVAEEQGKVVGTSASRTVADEVEVLNLGVDPSWRRRGVGRSLMHTALTEASQSGASRVFLEVRQSNVDARAFYTKLGFLEVGRRRAYYRDPAEDALVLSRSLSAP